MNIKLLSLTAVSAILFSTSAFSLPMIGFDKSGRAGGAGGALWRYADTWTYATDRGVDVKLSGSGGINNFVPGDKHEFTTQMAINSFQNPTQGTYAPAGLNALEADGGFEITKEVKLVDTVTSVTPNGINGLTVTFANKPGDTGTLKLYVDYYDSNTGDASKSSGTTGTTTVSCYGGPNNCAANTPNPQDQTGASTQLAPPSGHFGGPGAAEIGAILTAHMIQDTSSFTSDALLGPGHGTGSFQILWQIDTYDSRYINLANLGGSMIFSDLLDGTLTQAATQNPDHMYDGTPVAGNQLFDVTGKQTFDIQHIPEPSSLALLGAGLLAMAGFSRRKKA